MKEKTKFRILLVVGLLSVFSCGSREEIIPNKENTTTPKEKITEYPIYSVPVSGNSFITIDKGSKTAIITNSHLGNWTNPNTVISTYFRVSKKGKLNIGLKASVNPKGSTSVIKVVVNGVEKKVTLEGAESKEYNAGEFQISTPGYVKVDIQGVEKTGGYFADVTDITFSGEAATGENIFANNPNYYKNIRKGPSTDLYFNIPQEEVNYFYSEIVIPEDNPSIAFSPFNYNKSIFLVSSGTGKEKTIYFEVKNEFSKDSSKIPEDHKTKLIKKGDDVSVSESSDGVSVLNRGTLKYNWEAGKVYKFLVKVKPDGAGNLDYTAWFSPSEESSWRLIVSFKKHTAKVSDIKKIYSFLENSYPDHGYMSRKVECKNLWVRTKSEKWIPITKANFESYNSNVIYKQRTDAIAGVIKDGFFLQNGGFFNDIVKPGTTFSIPESTTPPDIDFSNLPN